MCCGCYNNDKVVLLTAQQWMSHSVGGLAPGPSKNQDLTLSLHRVTAADDNHNNVGCVGGK